MPGIIGLQKKRECPAIELRGILERISVPLQYAPTHPLTTYVYQRQAAGVVGHGFEVQKSGIAERDGVMVVMDGEVFPEATEVPSDLRDGAPTIQRAAFCLHRYLEEGPTFIERLNGTFGVAVVDSRNGSVHLGTDRFGHRLLFVWERDGECAFASSLRSLLLLEESIGRSYDCRSLAELIVFERVLGNRTLFPDVKRLQGGCRASWSGKGWEVTRYFSPRRVPLLSNLKSWEDGAAELERRLRHSLTKRLADKSKAGLFLSGGLDSRLVLGCAPRPVTAMTLSHPGWMPREAKVAARLASAAGAPLLLLEREADCYAKMAAQASEVNEGMATFVACHSLANHMQMAKEGIEVVLTGDRSDVAFKDYFAGSIDHDGLLPWTGSRLQIRRASRKLMSSPLIRRAAHQDLMMLALSPAMKLSFAQVWEETLEWVETMFHPGVPLEDTLSEMALCDWQGFTALGMLRGVSTGFVERSPFFDNDVWDLSLRLPISWRSGARIVMKAIMIAAPKLAAIPDAGTGIKPRTPAGLARTWTSAKGSLRSLAKRVLNRNSLAKPGPGRRAGATGIFANSGFHDRDLALKFSDPYRELVKSSISALPTDFFDVGTIQGLLESDLEADTPSLGKVFEILVTFGEFSRKWGIEASRTASPAPATIHRAGEV